MKKALWLCWVLLVCTCQAATNSATKAPLISGTGNPEVVAQLAPGKVFSRTAPGAHEMSYHVYVPTTFNAAKPPPLVVLFSPGGSGKGIMDSVKASAEKAGWVAIGCDKLKNNMGKDGIKEKEADLMEDEVLDDILQSLPTPKNRIYLGGMSGGAERAYDVSSRRKENFAGILAFGGWLGGRENWNKKYCKGMAVAMLNGDKDKNANAWVAGDTTALRRRSCRVKSFSFPGGHVVAPPESIDKALAWFEEDWLKTGSKRD